jgi:hypothetical protein
MVSCLFSFNETAADMSNEAYPEVACGKDYPFCAASTGDAGYTCFQVSGNAWMNKGMSHSNLESYMGWVPLAGSAIGNVLGGVISDKLFPYLGSSGRCLVCGVGNIISIFFVVQALLSQFPDCFLFMVASGLFGECYLGQSIALLSDATSPRIIVTSVSLFMFVITLMAGNAPLLVPAVRAMFASKFDYVAVYFDAASEYPGYIPHGFEDTQSVTYPNDNHFSVQLSGGGSRSLQWSLIVIFVSLYISSGILYILCFFKYRSAGLGTTTMLSFSEQVNFDSRANSSERKG